MKLKESVKEKLILIGLGIIAIILLVIVTNYQNNAYEECLIENNNNVNFCHKLVE